MKKSMLFLVLLSMLAFSACNKESVKEDYDKEDKGAYLDMDKEDCFELVYPITYIMPDDSEISINKDDDSDENTIKDWYLANPDSEEKPELVYPIDIEWKDGSTESIADEAAMELIKKDCYEEEDLANCDWDESVEASEADGYTKYVVKDLVMDGSCDCYTEGFLKFVKNNKTEYLIIYEAKDCLGWGYKVTCVNGDCKDKEAKKCKFEQNCAL